MNFSRSLLKLTQCLCVLWGVGSACLLASDGVSQRATALIQEGDNAYRNNKVAEAKSYYSSAFSLLSDAGASSELRDAVQERLKHCQATAGQEASISQRAAARKNDTTQQAMALLEEGRQFYKAAKYEDALRQYNAALSVLPKSPETDARRQFIVLSVADASVAVAQGYVKAGRYDEARKLLKDALKVNPQNKLALQQLAYLDDPVRNNPAQTPQNEANVNEVNRLLHLGYGYYDLGQYDDATKSFEAILRLDSYNTAARNGLSAVLKRKAAYFREARNQMRGEALAEVESIWEAPVPTLDAPLESMQSSGKSSLEVLSTPAKKLEDIILPRLNLDGVDIMEAVDYIRAQALRNDSSSADRGVNIMVDMADLSPEESKAILDKRFNLNLQNVPLKQALDYVAQMTGTVVRLGAYAVQLVPANADSGVLMTRKFSLPPAFFSGMGSEDSADTSADPFGDTPAATVTVKRTDPKEILSRMGVGFPDGASVNYDVGRNTLHVRNTGKNLDIIEDLIQSKAATQPVAIVVSATMIEVSEEVLKELGFEWLLSGNLNNAGTTLLTGGLSMVNPIGQELADSIPDIGPAGGKNIPAVTGGLRSGRNAFGSHSIEELLSSGTSHGAAASATRAAPSILSFRGVWAGADVTMIMRGLDQKKGVDILQKPNLVVAPGATAVFFSGREFIYPTEYEPAELPQSADSNLLRGPGQSQVSTMAVTPSHPGAYEMRQVGTILEVEAQPSEDRSMVDLQITPQIVDFEGFVDYGTPILANGMDAEGNIVSMVLAENRIAMPIFSVKTLTTKVTIATGHTVVLGGLQTAKNVKFEDKVPILGDVPLLGRLFRSEGQEQRRKVLLIMVRADVVDPGGKDARTGKSIMETGIKEAVEQP